MICCLPLPLFARAIRHVDPWVQAVRLRDQLEVTPPNQRSAAQFEIVLDSFRHIYHDEPTAAKAPAAVAAVADLLAEKGRLLGDQRALRAAIGQYEFLRQQYPNSSQVDNALLLEAEICRQDLKDLPCAAGKLRQVIAASPGSSFSEQAALELQELEPSAKHGQFRKSASAGASKRQSLSPGLTASAGNPPKRESVGKLTPQPAPQPDQPSVQQSAPQAVSTPASNPATTIGPSHQTPAVQPVLAAQDDTPLTSSESHRVVMITGMRHWSNPTSTRIAIDLSGKVEYEAARVPDPDRIFFDLHGARLAPNLNGHTVEVIDDGYLKRIRAAQFHPDVTRVVLDVTDVSQYSAFLLPNPWRLIIDIHSDKGASKAAIAQSRLSSVGPADSAELPLPPMLNQPDRAAANNATTTATGTKTTRDSTLADVARLSSEPAKITATAGPTSGPVSARVSEKNSSATDSDAAAGNSGPPGSAAAGTANASPSSSRSRKRTHSSSTNSTTSADLTTAPPIPHAADPTADGQRSLVRALGLKVGRIVIDAGHGGHDSGTLGPGGIQEKDVVLDVALRVGALLHKQLGAEIVYTRDDDTFIPLETRTAIANKAQADLFLSIHANSSSEPSARGVETYYLNFTSDPGALDVAARENAVSTQSVHQLSDLVRKITLKDKIDESREFAADVDDGLYAGLKAGNPGLKDRGVKKAPFVVLIGAQMPSILAEISFLTNPDDAEQLQKGSYRQRIAEALVSGVERYLRGLSGTRLPDATPSKTKIQRSANQVSTQTSGSASMR